MIVTIYFVLINQCKLAMIVPIILFVSFASLRPINNISVIKGRVFLGWTSTKLGLMSLAQGHNAVKSLTSDPQILGLQSSTLPLSHYTPIFQ